MALLHGSWLIKPEGCYLFIWGEEWQKITPKNNQHPLNISPEELNQSLINYYQNPHITKDYQWGEEVVYLPTIVTETESYPVYSLGDLRTEILPNEFKPWRIGGFYLNIIETHHLLDSISWGNLDQNIAFFANDLRFWKYVYQWTKDLLCRQKFIPIASPCNDSLKGQWEPFLDSANDQQILAELVQEMPSIHRAFKIYLNDDGVAKATISAHKLILDFITDHLNYHIKQWNPSQKVFPVIQSPLKEWLSGLTSKSGMVNLSKMEGSRLTSALNSWIWPVIEDVGNYISEQPHLRNWRSLFILTPPNLATENWQLKYGLQCTNEPDLIINGETVWEHPVNTLKIEINDRQLTIPDPQETLLKGLGNAVKLYPTIAPSLAESAPIGCELDPIQVYEFIRGVAQNLTDNGLGVIIPPTLRLEPGQNQRLGIRINAQIADSNSPFGLQSLLTLKLDLVCGGKVLNQGDFEQLLLQRSPIVNIDGQWIALQPQEVRAAQSLFQGSINDLNLRVLDALKLTQGEQQTIVKLPVVGFNPEGILQELIDSINQPSKMKALGEPPEFVGELRPYQSVGVSWLNFLTKWGLGACLADDMGLGKTIQLIAFLLHLKDQGKLQHPVLLICPTSVLGNWQREIKKFAPSLNILLHHGSNRLKGSKLTTGIKDKQLVLTSYPLVYRDITTLGKISWQGIILDEAQNIKNANTKQSQAIRNLMGGFRIALTGTPVENRLLELWSIMDFLNPNYLGEKQFFQKRLAIPIEKYGDRQALSLLRSLTQPFILRRLKTDQTIIPDLPNKQENIIFCSLSNEQANLYQRTVEISLNEITQSTGITRKGLILALLTKLKQICNHPAHFLKESSLGSGDRSSKVDRLESMLEELISNPNDRAILFTQYAEFGKLLKIYLSEKFHQSIPFLYGNISKDKRELMIDRFQHDPLAPPLLILSLKAGGTGINLTRANHVFHIDRWWNPAVEEQATDRVFRIGQTQNVQVHKFICVGTLEEKIHDMIESKKKIAQQTIATGENWLTELTNDQLTRLLLLDDQSLFS